MKRFFLFGVSFFLFLFSFAQSRKALPFTIEQVNGNILFSCIISPSTKAYLNAFWGQNGGITLWTGKGDASQWKIIDPITNEVITTPQNEKSYYIQSQMGSKLGQFLYNKDKTLLLSPQTSKESLFYFKTINPNNWAIYNAETHLPITPVSLKQNIYLGGPEPFTHQAILKKHTIYHQPCGINTSTYLRNLKIQGEDVLKELAFRGTPLNTHYFLETKNKFKISAGKDFWLKLDIAQAREKQQATIYFDWDGDGVFETELLHTSKLSISELVEVPSTALLFKDIRMRVYLNNNELKNPEADVEGKIYDFIFSIDKPRKNRLLKVDINDNSRGDVLLNDSIIANISAYVPLNEQIILKANPKGDSKFLGWRNNNTLLSSNPIFSFTLKQDINITACFSPNYALITSIDKTLSSNNNYILSYNNPHLKITNCPSFKRVNIYNANGELVVQSFKKEFEISLLEGNYIVQIQTLKENQTFKIFFY